MIIIGHKILDAVYRILTTQEPYQDLGYEYLQNQQKTKRVAYLKRQLEALGEAV